jgi:hypothetical protein
MVVTDVEVGVEADRCFPFPFVDTFPPDPACSALVATEPIGGSVVELAVQIDPDGDASSRVVTLMLDPRFLEQERQAVFARFPRFDAADVLADLPVGQHLAADVGCVDLPVSRLVFG